MLARADRLQGVTEADVVHSVSGHGLINGGHYIR
jgi:phenylacetate-CoA ligase